MNGGRQFELDIARGLAVFFMIAVHVLGVFSNTYVSDSVYGSIVYFLGGAPAAPVFMFLLGVGIIYSSKSEPQILMKRGLMILALGYLLNLLRGTIPTLIGFALTRDSDFLMSSIHEFLSIDILQFAGLSLIFFAICIKLKLNMAMIALCGVFLIFANILLLNFTTENLVLAGISGLFWGSNSISYFPFLSWIIYPIAGYIFGFYLIHTTNKPKFYIKIAIVSTMSLIFGLAIAWIFTVDLGEINDYAYYHHSIVGNMVFLSFVNLWIAVLYSISGLFVGAVRTLIERWSRNVTSIYFIHWILIGFLTILIAEGSVGIVVTVAITFAMIIISDILADRYRDAKIFS